MDETLVDRSYINNAIDERRSVNKAPTLKYIVGFLIRLTRSTFFQKREFWCLVKDSGTWHFLKTKVSFLASGSQTVSREMFFDKSPRLFLVDDS